MSDEDVEPVKRALRRLALGQAPPTTGGPANGNHSHCDPPNGPRGGGEPRSPEVPRAADDSRPERTVENAVERAEAAVLDVHTAATFADDGGFGRLEAAVDAAESGGRVALADRGRAVLATVAAYRTAWADHVHSGREGLMTGEQVLPEEIQ